MPIHRRSRPQVPRLESLEGRRLLSRGGFGFGPGEAAPSWRPMAPALAFDPGRGPGPGAMPGGFDGPRHGDHGPMGDRSMVVDVRFEIAPSSIRRATDEWQPDPPAGLPRPSGDGAVGIRTVAVMGGFPGPGPRSEGPPPGARMLARLSPGGGERSDGPPGRFDAPAPPFGMTPPVVSAAVAPAASAEHGPEATAPAATAGRVLTMVPPVATPNLAPPPGRPATGSIAPGNDGPTLPPGMAPEAPREATPLAPMAPARVQAGPIEAAPAPGPEADAPLPGPRGSELLSDAAPLDERLLADLVDRILGQVDDDGEPEREQAGLVPALMLTSAALAGAEAVRRWQSRRSTLRPVAAWTPRGPSRSRLV